MSLTTMKPGGQVESVDTTDDGDVIVGFRTRVAAEQVSILVLTMTSQSNDAWPRHWRRARTSPPSDRFRYPGTKLSNLRRAPQSHPLLLDRLPPSKIKLAWNDSSRQAYRTIHTCTKRRVPLGGVATTLRMDSGCYKCVQLEEHPIVLLSVCYRV